MGNLGRLVLRAMLGGVLLIVVGVGLIAVSLAAMYSDWRWAESA